MIGEQSALSRTHENGWLKSLSILIPNFYDILTGIERRLFHAAETDKRPGHLRVLPRVSLLAERVLEPSRSHRTVSNADLFECRSNMYYGYERPSRPLGMDVPRQLEYRAEVS